MSKQTQWAPIPGFPGYEASETGSIRNINTGKVLSPTKTKKGYLKTNLRLNTIPTHVLIHRAVMAAFHGVSELQVNHKNGVKDDNRLENLEYVTQSENILHAFKQGAYTRKGEQNPSAKLDWDKVDTIREAYGRGASINELMEKYEMSNSAIYNIVTYRKWKPETRKDAVERPTVEVKIDRRFKREEQVLKPGQKRKARRTTVENRTDD